MFLHDALHEVSALYAEQARAKPLDWSLEILPGLPPQMQGVSLLSLDIGLLRRGRGLGAAGARDAGIERLQPLVQIHRVHLGQQLPGPDLVADIGLHRQHPTRAGGTQHPVAPGFERADAEQLGREATGPGLGDRDLDRRQRAGAQQHEQEQQHQQRDRGTEQKAPLERDGNGHRVFTFRGFTSRAAGCPAP